MLNDFGDFFCVFFVECLGKFCWFFVQYDLFRVLVFLLCILVSVGGIFFVC